MPNVPKKPKVPDMPNVPNGQGRRRMDDEGGGRRAVHGLNSTSYDDTGERADAVGILADSGINPLVLLYHKILGLSTSNRKETRAGAKSRRRALIA